jgi:hypothetical protein
LTGRVIGHYHEVRFPRTLPLVPAFANEFAGLTNDDVSLTLLEQIQEHLMSQLPSALTQRERDFLLSLVRAEPAWDLMPFPNLRHLPALQCRLLNLCKWVAAVWPQRVFHN